ncbi:MAG: hypothetical protein NC311_12385 [Muribaculaceae bacterium]|nr:hypothetical protein [Muribaculaceae bacterium]
MAYYWLKINGKYSDPIPTPDIGEARIFRAQNNVLAAAIKRTSKNRYNLYCITKNDGFCLPFNGFGVAIDYLQKLYND